MLNTRHHAYPVALLTAGHFLSDFYSNFLPALLPVVMANLGLSLTASGLLVMVYSFTASILQPLCGYYVDKYGLTKLVLITLPANAVFICLSGMAPSYAILIACIALAGLGSSFYHPLGSSLISKVTPPANKGFAMSVFIGGGNFGFALAPATIIYMLVKFNVGSLPWLIIPACLLTVGYYYYGMHRIPLKAAFNPTATTSTAWYKSWSLFKLNAVMAFRSWSQIALPSFLPIWLSQQGQPPTLAGSLLTVFLLGGALGGFAGGWLGDRFGRKVCIIACLTCCLPAMFIFLYSQQITWLSWVALAIAGAAMQGTLPSSVIWAQEMAPAKAAMASGMMMGLSFGLGGMGTAITGAMADVVGLHTALLWSLLPLALAIPITCSIPEKQSTCPTAATQISN